MPHITSQHEHARYRGIHLPPVFPEELQSGTVVQVETGRKRIVEDVLQFSRSPVERLTGVDEREVIGGEDGKSGRSGRPVNRVCWLLR